MTGTPGLVASIAAAASLLAQSGPQASPPSTQASIEVVGVAPVDGGGIEAGRYPANVQVLAARTGPAADALVRGAASVQLNESQGDRFQPDVAFRGFLVSPLLGVPPGVAVFQDGVRLNDPFGEVVHWDAVAGRTLASIQLIPRSDAAFGLNALGGVFALRTKTGRTDPGLSAA